jgi:FkbM family methyltransferase
MVNEVERFVRRHPMLRHLLVLPRAARRSFLSTQEARAKEVIDRFSSLVEEDVAVRIDEFSGIFNMSPRSDLFRRIIAHGSYEPTLSRLFLDSINPDLDVIDVGANIGFYTIAGAKKLKVGRILAAEPTQGAFARLKANVERNEVTGRVILFKGLISAKAGNEALNTIVGREEYSSTGPMTHPSIANVAYSIESVQAAKLDDLVSLHQLRPGLMKVDVEGAEAQVFAGASEMLARFRPTVLCEVSNQLLRAHGVEGRDIVQIFERLDYKVVDPHDPRAQPGMADFGDIFCIPRR